MPETKEVVGALIGLGFLLDLGLSHRQRAIYARFKRWQKWLAGTQLREGIQQAGIQGATFIEAVFGRRIVSVRSILTGAAVAFALAVARQSWIMGIPRVRVAIWTTVLVAVVTATAGSCSFVATRVLLRIASRQITLRRTLLVFVAELLVIKVFVLVCLVIVVMVSVAILLTGIHRDVPPESIGQLIYAFVMMLLFFGNQVILPCSLALTGVHAGAALVFVVLHFVALMSRWLALLVRGIVKTEKRAFTTCAGVVSALFAIASFAFPFMHLKEWGKAFVDWQAGIDMAVVRHATSFLIRLYLGTLPND